MDSQAKIIRCTLRELVLYFLRLGATGFGGPIALVGYMERDLVEDRCWISTEDFKLSLALAQLAPGPLAAQTAIGIGYARGGVLGATLVGAGFILSSFLMVVAIGAAYVRYGGLRWMQALFFAKAGTFVFGSGLAIVPFLYGGVVQDYHWLTEGQFLDAVAVAMITPGPVVITVAFIGYLVAGLAGSCLAAWGVFLPVYLFVVIPFPWFKKHGGNPHLAAFVDGVTAAAVGAISGAVFVLGTKAIRDVPTAAIAAVSLLMLIRFKLLEPLLVGAAGIAGLMLFKG